MPLRLEIVGGPHAGVRLDIAEGETARVGRGAPADHRLPVDPRLSVTHFEVAPDGADWVLRDLGSTNGTFVNDRRIQERRLEGGDSIQAGDSRFLVTVEGRRRKPNEILQALARTPSLFAVLDAARTPSVLELLATAGERFESLYEGESAAQLGGCAPYLAQLPYRSRLLRKLFKNGWGQAWGVYLVCDEPFEAVRKHLRRFLRVQGAAGEWYYFRFYDPRVLRVFLPSCPPDQAAEFFGPIRCYLAEDAGGQCRKFEPGPGAVTAGSFG